MPYPKQFKSEYCDQLIAHMAKGFDFKSFGSLVDAGESTLHFWAKTYPDFAEAKEIAEAKASKYLQQIGLDLMNGVIEKGNPAAWIFTVKNRLKWTDQSKVTVDGKLTLEELVLGSFKDKNEQSTK